MSHSLTAALCLLFSIGMLAGCKETPQIQTITGKAQGTTYSVKYWQTAENTTDNETLKVAIDTEIARIDKLMSNYRDDSAIEVFNNNKVANRPIMLDGEILSLLNISAEIYEKSQHCYDPTIKPLFNIWGFKADKLSIPNEATIQQTLTGIGFNQLIRDNQTITKTHPEQTIDLSAIGQGYAVSRISALLTARGITNYLTEIGGEMLVSGKKPDEKRWKVGIERPIPNSKKISEVITLTGNRPTAIMTSGTYRHYFDENGKQYSHILDPRTGKPVEHNSVAVTVLVDNATYADAWSTALLCLGSEAGLAIANQENIPAIFYDMDENQQLTRQASHAVAKQSANWVIE